MIYNYYKSSIAFSGHFRSDPRQQCHTLRAEESRNVCDAGE